MGLHMLTPHQQRLMAALNGGEPLDEPEPPEKPPDLADSASRIPSVSVCPESDKQGTSCRVPSVSVCPESDKQGTSWCGFFCCSSNSPEPVDMTDDGLLQSSNLDTLPGLDVQQKNADGEKKNAERPVQKAGMKGSRNRDSTSTENSVFQFEGRGPGDANMSGSVTEGIPSTKRSTGEGNPRTTSLDHLERRESPASSRNSVIL